MDICSNMYQPPRSSGLLSLWIVIIPAATGLVVLCLVYLASPKKMQDWTIERIGNEDERKDAADVGQNNKENGAEIIV